MEPNPYGALKKTVLTGMIVVPFVPFVLALGIGYYYFAAALENTTVARMQRIVADHRHMIQSFLMERKADLEFVHDTHRFEWLQQQQNLQRTLEFLQKKSNAFVDLGVFDQNGLHVAYCGPYQLSGKYYDQAPWFKAAMANDFFISDVFLGYRQVPHFVIAVTQGHQAHRWLIRATIDTRIFNELVRSVRIGKSGEAYLLDNSGVFQTERRSGSGLMQKDPDHAKYGTVHDGIRTFIDADENGKTYLYATTWLKDNDWLLVIRQEKADAFQALRRAAYLILLTSLLGGGVIVALAFLVTEGIIHRMERIDKEKDHLGEQLIRAGRLAEIGEMAAGFAHEINNPLQIIKSEYALIEMTMTQLKEGRHVLPSQALTDLDDSIGQIKQQVNRCAEVTRSILQFARKGEPAALDIDLRGFIPEVIAMISKRADVHGIDIAQQVAGDIAPVHGDPGYLQQVLVNLLNNAIDAIIARHGASGGRLRIEAQSSENSTVEIRVTDNGSGIGPENLKKIFTPFFTTKPVGKGTGLGLSVCYGIVQKMGGKMSVDSQEGAGTTFSIALPSQRRQPVT